MARRLVEKKAVSIRFACEVFGISETCYRYQPKLSDENAEIADWLIRLTHNWKDWGFGLCYLFLRNVKGFPWNHKRVYRIYKELELNLRIKPKKRIVREKPEPLTVPMDINQSWSMDFMHDSLDDGRTFRLLNVIDDFNREGLGIEVDFSLPGERVIRTLDRIIEWRAASHSPYVAIMDQNISVLRLPPGLRNTAFTWITSNQASRSRTPTSSDSTERCATPG